MRTVVAFVSNSIIRFQGAFYGSRFSVRPFFIRLGGRRLDCCLALDFGWDEFQVTHYQKAANLPRSRDVC